jgi:2-(1,2-epoxy-1,2-dihydrophenyl)acetyl-CoA isomerase
MSYQTILCDVSDGIARLTLNRPDRLNSFNVEMHGEVRDALSKLAQDRAARVLVLTGAGVASAPARSGDRRLHWRQGVDPASRSTSTTPLAGPALCRASHRRSQRRRCRRARTRLSRSRGRDCSASFIQSFSKLGLALIRWHAAAGHRHVRWGAHRWQTNSRQQAAQWGLIWRCVEDMEFKQTVTRSRSSWRSHRRAAWHDQAGDLRIVGWSFEQASIRNAILA